MTTDAGGEARRSAPMAPASTGMGTLSAGSVTAGSVPPAPPRSAGFLGRLFGGSSGRPASAGGPPTVPWGRKEKKKAKRKNHWRSEPPGNENIYIGQSF